MRTKVQLSKSDREIRTWMIIVSICLFLVIILGWYVKVREKFEKDQRRLKGQWEQVRSAYQRRTYLITNIANSARAYATLEKEAFVAVFDARTKTFDIYVHPIRMNDSILAEYDAAQDELANSLTNLLAALEKYPELKENRTFMRLQTGLEGCENKIATERRNFNEATLKFNTKIHTFPKNIAARIMGLKDRPYLVLRDETGVAPAS